MKNVYLGMLGQELLSIIVTKKHFHFLQQHKLQQKKNTTLLTRCITYLRRSSRYSGGINLPHGGRVVISIHKRILRNVYGIYDNYVRLELLS